MFITSYSKFSAIETKLCMYYLSNDSINCAELIKQEIPASRVESVIRRIPEPLMLVR
jgi:hypothetical protein